MYCSVTGKWQRKPLFVSNQLFHLNFWRRLKFMSVDIQEVYNISNENKSTCMIEYTLYPKSPTQPPHTVFLLVEIDWFALENLCTVLREQEFFEYCQILSNLRSRIVKGASFLMFIKKKMMLQTTGIYVYPTHHSDRSNFEC